MIFLGKPKHKMSDGEVLEKFKTSGKPEWLDELFRRYSGLSYGVCLKYLKNTEDAKDAVMQVFAKLQSELHNHDPRNFKSWLYVVLKNHCLMGLRANSKVFSEELQDLKMEEDEPSSELDLQAMEVAIEQLNEDQKTCIKLFYIEGLSYKELETKTGFTAMEVKSFIQNGKRNLRLALERNHETE